MSWDLLFFAAFGTQWSVKKAWGSLLDVTGMAQLPLHHSQPPDMSQSGPAEEPAG